MKVDRVLTINDYYDGPRLGVAEYMGIPHIYEAEFDHSAEDYGDTYFLSPIDSDLLESVLEAWTIWLRWESSKSIGEINQDSATSLPEDRKRHEELKVAIGNRLRVDPEKRLYVKAIFTTIPDEPFWSNQAVLWKLIST